MLSYWPPHRLRPQIVSYRICQRTDKLAICLRVSWLALSPPFNYA